MHAIDGIADTLGSRSRKEVQESKSDRKKWMQRWD